MSSETTIEMSPVSPRGLSKPNLHLDIERASKSKSTRKSDDDMDILLIANERNSLDDHPATKPLLPPALSRPGREGASHGIEHIPLAPLLETDSVGQKVPLAGPEIDDLDDTPEINTPFHGIDDGLSEPAATDKGKHFPDIDEVDGRTDGHGHDGDEKSGHGHGHENGGTFHEQPHDEEDGKLLGHAFDEVDYFGDLHSPHGIESRFGIERPISPLDGRIIPDVNVYQQKKNLAQGMMDLALLSANANQLRYVIESASEHPYFWPSLIFISISIIFQILVGIGLIMNSTYNVKNEDDICKADKINNLTIIGIFLVTIVNVFITAFSVAQKPIATA